VIIKTEEVHRKISDPLGQKFLNGTSVLLEVTDDSPAKIASAGSRSFIMVTSEVVSLDAAALPVNEQGLMAD